MSADVRASVERFIAYRERARAEEAAREAARLEREAEATTVDQFILRWVPHRMYPDGNGGWVRDRDRAMMADLYRMLRGAK